MNYKVSALIPIYNVEAYIERCARSLFEQTYPNLEYVFVNDCTPDRSMDILKRAMEDYPERAKTSDFSNTAQTKDSPFRGIRPTTTPPASL